MPTLIQEASFFISERGKDANKAQTGTGKTLAYLLPVIQEDTQKKNGDVYGSPSARRRELSRQILMCCAPLAIKSISTLPEALIIERTHDRKPAAQAETRSGCH